MQGTYAICEGAERVPFGGSRKRGRRIPLPLLGTGLYAVCLALVGKIKLMILERKVRQHYFSAKQRKGGSVQGHVLKVEIRSGSGRALAPASKVGCCWLNHRHSGSVSFCTSASGRRFCCQSADAASWHEAL